MKKLKKNYVERLRPASPPKTNPWTTKRPVAKLTPDWPSITEDFNTAGNAVKEAAVDDYQKKAQKKETSCESSTENCSTDNKGRETVSLSRRALQAAAPRAGNSLWMRPFGADVFVWVGRHIFEVHRSIIEPESTWFRIHLPPKEEGCIPVDIHLDFCHTHVGCTLRFMYTKRLEICEYDREKPRDLIHIPRSALLYVGAIDLGVEGMKNLILRILQQTATDLATYLIANQLNEALTEQEIVNAVIHLHNALDIAYSSGSQTEMLPIRLALVNILDTLLPILIRHPAALDLLSSNIWRKYSTAISTDLLAVREKGYSSRNNMKHANGGAFIGGDAS